LDQDLSFPRAQKLTLRTKSDTSNLQFVLNLVAPSVVHLALPSFPIHGDLKREILPNALSNRIPLARIKVLELYDSNRLTGLYSVVKADMGKVAKSMPTMTTLLFSGIRLSCPIVSYAGISQPLVDAFGVLEIIRFNFLNSYNRPEGDIMDRVVNLAGRMIGLHRDFRSPIQEMSFNSTPRKLADVERLAQNVKFTILDDGLSESPIGKLYNCDM